jgi:hypothetical protein
LAGAGWADSDFLAMISSRVIEFPLHSSYAKKP